MALPVVVALVVVGALLVAGVTATSLSSIGSATSLRASVQSQAAAEAGLAAAQAAIVAAPVGGPLLCTYSSSAPPVFSVQVAYGAGVAGAPACPAPAGALGGVGAGAALLVSTGRAATGGSQGVTAGDVRRLQAVLTAPAAGAPPAASSGGAGGAGTTALALFGQRGVTAQNLLEVAASAPGAEDGDVYADSGGVSCLSSASVEGTVLSQSDITLPNRCTVSAVWSAGRVAVQDATVRGDVFAASTSTDAGAPAVRLTNSSARVGGNVYTNGAVRVSDASVGGSVLSTASTITMTNRPAVGGSTYGALGILLDQGSVGMDAVSTRGSLPDPQNPGAVVGGDAVAAGCISSRVTVRGTTSPPASRTGAACGANAPATSAPVLPERPHNPAGVPTTALPTAVAAPPRLAFPTLPSRPVGGRDPLDAWRAAGWQVEVFSGAGSCTAAFDHLARAVQPATAEGAAWAAAPLAVVVRDCSQPLQLDGGNKALLRGSDTLTLLNDLAVISDAGITNQNASGIASSAAGHDRDLYWIVPSDSPAVSASAFPSCSGTGSLVPSGLRNLKDVRWFLYTPCAVSGSNPVGAATTPLRGSVYGGSVSLSSLSMRFTPLAVPGLSGGGVTSSANSPVSATAPPTSSGGWILADVRDVSNR
ncbi:hypothetical protein [Quadrisphaera setariae]|uniref:Uncharacterized protein n=1 Tax=Quadrisphaera setariae TaxID=2593304 RepID=A0A5C8Z351_9ACTN|nr:hypothetical protein [Quadrisphaera setariae]TXR52522.1 hypothetical protein FMM08_18875 [Quadrisphaera setariae]